MNQSIFASRLTQIKRLVFFTLTSFITVFSAEVSAHPTYRYIFM
ncbi:MAG: hypothetical protein ACRYFL_12470 [Janthinobacterium lividum]